MVLYKRKPILIHAPPKLPDNAEVYVMRGTNEVFQDYEDYLRRLDYLRQKKFVDAVNGKSGMTFFDALTSENKSSDAIENVFPDVLKDPILRKVQFSTISRIDDLVSSVFDEFKKDFFPGEEVLVVFDDGEQMEGVIREKAKFPMIRGPDGAVQRAAFSRYFVRTNNTAGEEALVDDIHIRRDKKMFTKQNLRSFLKNSLQREAWIGAPWLVKEHLAIQYRLPMEIPGHLLQDAKLLANKQQMLQMKPPKGRRSNKSDELVRQQQELVRMQQMQQQHPGAPPHQLAQMAQQYNHSLASHPKPPPPPPIRYPIEDLDVAPKRDGYARPQLKFQTDEQKEYVLTNRQISFENITMESQGMLLEVWNTLNVQCEVYYLDSFTFDDFVDAMQYKSSNPPCQLLEEVYCAVLNMLVDKNGKLQVKGGMVELAAEVNEESSEAHDDSEYSTPQPDVPARSTRSRLSHVDPAVENQRTPTTVPAHRAAEMLGERSWRTRLGAREMEDGGWQLILVGLLHQLSANAMFKARCDKILAELAPMEMPATKDTAWEQFTQLDVNLRVSALQMITILSLSTPAVKEFLEHCSDDMTDVRKRKIEHQREKKAAMEELQNKDRERKILLPENMPASPSAEQMDVDQTPAEGDDTLETNEAGSSDAEDEEPSAGRSLRRGNDRKRKREEEAAKREEERAKKAEAAKQQSKLSKEFKKLLNEIESLKKKIVDAEAKIEECDADLREANVQRTKVLGKDRQESPFSCTGRPTSSQSSPHCLRWQQHQNYIMDAAGLRTRIQAVLDSNADIRRQAELDLKQAEESTGFLDALLNILEQEQDTAVRLSSVVYFKNRINRGWAKPDEGQIPNPISEQEKAAVRQRLVPIIAHAAPKPRAQLIVALQKILHCDFPKEWPDFVDTTIKLLNTQDVPSVFAGLQCLLAICRTYRFKLGDSRGDFDQIVAATFPQVLQIGNSLVNETSLEAGEMLRTVLKAYKHAIYFELPMQLRSHQAMVDWCTLFLKVVEKEPPENAMMEDLDERELNHWWKCKKWAYVNLNRLFVRYGNPSSLQKGNGEDYAEVAKSFINNFAPEILKGYLRQVELWVQKQRWLSKPALSFTLAFMDECVKPKAMWDCLKPHMPILIEHLLFPVLCQSDEDLEQFDEEPAEYLHRKLNFYEEVSAPDVAATNFLIALTKARRKQTFEVLAFINGIVNKYEAAPDDQKNPREKEGALRMIGTLANVILGKKSPIADQVEYFFVRHVFPEFRSPHGFLRARACDTLEKFESLDFKDPNNLTIIYRNILESMADPCLPVRVEASLALQPLIRHEPIRVMMQQNIPQIMQQLLKLANEVDVDALANVMEDFVEVFAAELTPFAVALSEQLRDTYVRIVRELIERNQSKDGGDDNYGDFLDDKSITALGVLQTIGTLILTLESTPDVLAHLETILMPVITITLEHKLYDLYNEVFEIIDSCTFAAKVISPTMWRAYELIHETFKSGAELYLEDMLPALENFVNYGAAHLMQSRPYLEAAVDMVRTIFRDEKVGGVDRICGCKLAEIMMLNLRGGIDDYVPEFITLAMSVLTNDQLKVKSYRIHLMEMVINGIYYNPNLAMQVLEANGWTNKFFSLWFSSIDSFTRVHDKKLSIGAITALLTMSSQDVPTSVQNGWPRLLQGIVRLFQTLPTAMKNREEAQQDEDFGVGGDYDDDEEEEDEWEGGEDWENEEEAETEDVKDESTAYLDFLSQQAAKFSASVEGDEEEDVLEEESLLETPLDRMEPYGLFKRVFLEMNNQDPVFYTHLTSSLSAEEQQVLRATVEQADRLALEQQQQQQMAAQAAAGGNPAVAPPQMNGAS